MLRNNLGAATSSRFRVLDALGAGSFGTVVEAEDLRSSQRVALKELGVVQPESITRFKQEFRALVDYHHPNLVGLKELIEEDGRWLIVMELVPGQDFLSYVRPAAANDNALACDEARLRKALLGIAKGLVALHGYGVMHRDLKPSNVRVTPEGRAVLLDFGLVTSVDPTRQSAHAMTLGTVAYMAPEQAIRRNIGPAADWYALGVCLFQALTGRLPFESDAPFQLLADKQQRPAPRASSFAPDVAGDLDELCARLLTTKPEERAGADDVLRVLGASDQPVEDASALTSAPFAGREIELQHLEHALARTHEGELAIVLVDGESGVGKSELVGEFLRAARERSPTLIALQGRCYENEQVAYKAFDGCVDELARLLRGMDERAAAALMPPRATLLGQLFPVLRDIPAIAKAPRNNLSADPTARRIEAFGALAGLLARLAEERPVVLAVDDLQWADAESFRLLQALLQQPEPPPVLIVATIRPHGELDAQVSAQLETLRKLKPLDVIKLIGLPLVQAQALAAKLLGPGTPPRWLRAIAEESDGHPLLLFELVRFTQTHDLGSRALTLEAALRARIERLDPDARALLELVALAGRPYESHIFAQALGVESVDEPARAVLSAKLARLRRGHELHSYHDRIRHTTVNLIARNELATLHGRLAEALERTGHADISEQARHWDLAGDRTRAVSAYQRAATHALETLAFARAAKLCERAIELIASEADPRTQALMMQRAHALACMGLSSEAAVLYRRAADRAEGESRIRLRSRYAQHLMMGSKVTQGYATARELLRELGISVPAGLAGWFLRFGWDWLWLALRGDRVASAQGREAPRRRLAREVLDELRPVVACLHPTVYLLLMLQRMRLSADSRSESDVAHSFASRGWLKSVSKSLAAAMPLFEQSRKLIAKEKDPASLALRAHVEGSARLAGWDFVGSRGYLEEAQRLLQEHCPDQPWLLTLVRYHLGLVWYHLGEFERVRRDVDSWLDEARERNDSVATALLTGMGHGFMRYLVADSPERALEALDRALAPLPPEPYSFAHFGYLMGTQYALLYQGGSGALRWLDNYEAEHKKVFLLKTRMGRETLMMYRALATLRALEDADPNERASLLEREKKLLAIMLKNGAPFAQAQAKNLAAQVHALEGDRERALVLVREARAQLEQLQHVGVLATLYLEGAIEGGVEGRCKCDRAVDVMASRGWKNPRRALGTMLPAVASIMSVRASESKRELLLGRYEVMRRLGSGGFSSVFEARDVQTGRSVALKELVRGGASSLERFKREFRALQNVHHANVARLEALFEHEGTWHIAMELVEGDDLLRYVRPNDRLDRERLEHAMLGVCEGLMALHNAGFAHRDLKPDNVVVTSAGRAVLLDFGLIARPGSEQETAPVGSIEFAAPEQLEGAAPSVSADIYALGSCLYRALTGRSPFQADTQAQLLQKKKKGRPRPIYDGGHDELAELTLRALAIDPSERPALDELMAALARRQARPEPLELRAKSEPRVQFAGRERELASLAQAFEQTDDGCTIALVEGESGLGKTALVSEFARGLVASYPRLLLLESRCYESEQVAFKAFDGAVDQLAQVLRALPNPECEALLPKHAALLAQLFPVLAGVPTIAQAPKKGLPAEPSARRLGAIDCFVELLEKLCERYELLFVIDDLQWADSESFALFSRLLTQPERLPALFVCTVRPASELDTSAERALHELAQHPNTAVIALEGLAHDAAAALASELFGAPLEADRLERLITESKGHPLFMRELVEQAKSGDRPSRPLTLDQALSVRIESFPYSARRLLSLAALAVKPYGLHVFARALKLRELPTQDLVALLGRGLLRRRGDELTCYHDRIRHAALALLGAAERSELAIALAEALELEGKADAAERARLWDEAGKAEPASAAYELAGKRALEGLAFDAALRHYERALALIDRDDERHQRLFVEHAHALARAGRSADAARRFQAAAEHAQGEQQVRLRIWAAQHLIQSAEVDEGLNAASALLHELGVSLPTSERGALLRLAWERTRVDLRGIKLKPRKRPIDQRERLVLEALHGLSSTVRGVAYLPGSMLTALYLRRALDAGEPVHTARALAYDALVRSTRYLRSDVGALFAESRALAADLPAVTAEIEVVWGLSCLARRGFGQAIQHLSLGHEMLSSRCPGEPWLLTLARMYLGSAWAQSGDFAAIARHTGDWLEQARSRDDRYALAALAGFGSAGLRHLMRDDVAAAEAELDEAIAPWEGKPFSTVHFGALMGRGFLMIYRGGASALAWVDQTLPALEHYYLLKTPTARAWLASLRVVACLSAASEERGARAEALFERAERELVPLRHSSISLTSGFVLLVQGYLHALRGRREQALALVQSGFEDVSNGGHYVRYGAAHAYGLLEGGEAGRARSEAVIAHVRAEGWVNPERALNLFFPVRGL